MTNPVGVGNKGLLPGDPLGYAGLITRPLKEQIEKFLLIERGKRNGNNGGKNIDIVDSKNIDNNTVTIMITMINTHVTIIIMIPVMIMIIITTIIIIIIIIMIIM